MTMQLPSYVKVKHGEWRTDTPATGAQVLVTVTDGIRPRVCEASWDREYKIWHMSGGPRERSDVSAWMPMPEPFKPEPTGGALHCKEHGGYGFSSDCEECKDFEARR